MRVILDTNILVSALITSGSAPDRLYKLWQQGAFSLITSDHQLEEFRKVTRYPRVRRYILPAEAGAMLNEIRRLAVRLSRLPKVAASPDPDDNFLLGMAVAGKADYLVTGDKTDLLKLGRFRHTRIVTALSAGRAYPTSKSIV